MTDGLSGYSCDQGNVTVSWPTATAGRLVLLKGAGSGGGGGVNADDVVDAEFEVGEDK